LGLAEFVYLLRRFKYLSGKSSDMMRMALFVMKGLRKMQYAAIPQVAQVLQLGVLSAFVMSIKQDTLTQCGFRNRQLFQFELAEDLFKDKCAGGDDISPARVDAFK